MTDPQVIVNLGTGGSQLNATNGSSSSADSNDALFLDWPGDNTGNYVYLPGAASNFLSSPDSAALDITGDIDIRVHCALDDWTPSALQALASKFQTTSNQRSWEFRVQTAGTLELVYSADGATATTATSTVATGFTDGTASWVRVTLDVNNGAAGRDVKFYTSTDGSTWSQLGSTVTVAGVTSIFAGSAQFEIGSTSGGGTRVAAGKFYRVIVMNGIAGTTVMDADCSVLTAGSATTFTEKSSNAATVTINRSSSGRKSVAVVSPVFLFGTDDYMEVADNALLDFGASDSFHLVCVARQWATPANFGRYIEKWDYSIANDAGYQLGYDSSGNVGIYIDDGPNSQQQVVAYTAGAVRVYHGFVDRSIQGLNAGNNNTYASEVGISSVGSLVNPRVLRIGRAIGAGGYQDFELVSVAIFRRRLTTTEIGQLVTYYQARLS